MARCEYIAAHRDTPHGPEVRIGLRPARFGDWLRVARLTFKFWRCPVEDGSPEFGRLDWSTARDVAEGIVGIRRER